MTGLDAELAIEAAEARVAAALDAHGSAVIRACVDGAPPPPWPAVVATPAHGRLAATHDRGWAARARTLRRWCAAARLAADPAVVAAAHGPPTVAGVAARFAALDGAARRLGLGSGRRAATDLTGVAGSLAWPGATEAAAAEADPEPPHPTAPLPAWTTVRDHLAACADVDPAALVVVARAARAATVTRTAGAVAVFPPVVDLASLTVAAHELGHGLYAQAMVGLPLGLAAAPSRAVDEAVAAWAVRALEDVLAPAWAAVAAWRRRRGEVLRRRLAAVAETALAGGDVAAAWRAALGAREPARYPVVLDEPVAVIAYAVADRLALMPGPGELARWGQVGAALDVTTLGPRAAEILA
ncbi:MAG: hypothetical protein R3B06_19745 [Kofleriaceae bacterium]